MRGVVDTTLCDKVCQWLSPGTPVSSENIDKSGVKHHNPYPLKNKTNIQIIYLSRLRLR